MKERGNPQASHVYSVELQSARANGMPRPASTSRRGGLACPPHHTAWASDGPAGGPLVLAQPVSLDPAEQRRLDALCAASRQSGASFVTGLHGDQDAVTSGRTLPYSSGPVEGHINRSKQSRDEERMPESEFAVVDREDGMPPPSGSVECFSAIMK
ncbi:transposase [Nonomuraea basaltis]|uniref:transposase n=1 Tax=Nonomuraea basaltis TaxID=2495887 RepID=UPI00197CF321|nr:transposase [Nonomuraea basaltis]